MIYNKGNSHLLEFDIFVLFVIFVIHVHHNVVLFMSIPGARGGKETRGGGAQKTLAK